MHSTYRTLFVSLLLFACVLKSKAQPPVFRVQSYIETYSLEAVHQMVNYKIPASVIMAQAIFESQSGSSELARKSNNHFGIKCHLEWGGDTVLKDDDSLNECFRSYEKIEDSFTDHSLFLSSRARYAALFDLPSWDYKSWCTGLKASGYATYPGYADDLIRLIEQAKLYELDNYENLSSLDATYFYDLQEPIPSLFNPEELVIEEFYQSGILWEDESDFLVQSLDFIIESGDPCDTETENVCYADEE